MVTTTLRGLLNFQQTRGLILRMILLQSVQI
jgi:hypothetical protein